MQSDRRHRGDGDRVARRQAPSASLIGGSGSAGTNTIRSSAGPAADRDAGPRPRPRAPRSRASTAGRASAASSSGRRASRRSSTRPNHGRAPALAAAARASGSRRQDARRRSATTYSYSANLAVGLCEGPDRRRAPGLGGRPRTRPDDADDAGATRATRRSCPTRSWSPRKAPTRCLHISGLAYVVFERLPVADFGNRVPQFSFEVLKPVDGLGDDGCAPSA